MTTASEPRSYLLSCPAHECGGYARAMLQVDARSHEPALILAEDQSPDHRCMDCGSVFQVDTSGMGYRGGLGRVKVLSLDTYDDERVVVHPGMIFVIAVAGRLDLFALDVLQRAWFSVPPPRRIIVDLEQATEVTSRALKLLCELRHHDPNDRGCIVAPAEAAVRSAFDPEMESVYAKRQAASHAMGVSDAASFGSFCSTVELEGSEIPARRDRSGPRPSLFARPLIEVEPVGEVTIVTLLPRNILDPQNIKLLALQLFSVVDECQCTKILLNFRNVEYISSTGLGTLMHLDKKLRANSGRLVVCSIGPSQLEVFHITKLSRLFSIYDDEQTALQSF